MVSRFTDFESNNSNPGWILFILLCICLIFYALFLWISQSLWVSPAQCAERYFNNPVVIRQRILEYIRVANPKLKPEECHEMATAIMMAANVHRIPVGLIVAVCHAESNFRCNAIGPKVKGGHAIGPMQVLWPLHQDLAKSRNITEAGMFTAIGGIDIGCVLLRQYIQDERSIIGALGRYLGKNSRAYILEKVVAGWIAFESGVPIDVGHIQESSKMRKLVRGR